ncbi:DUF411 domain-containing protein [Hyphomicrobium sp.]|uniref:DUF411 domain-containing protein n=1 Tax=Hyphomicrobium sp. TaxID=82 RepID=UPI000FA5FD51|nr:DUF411 domain-containing protein [Hyphomicrobium sp.]RUP07398.1 MAG: DUF411 domain-containing protein [Hyphomicrobium sp.]
MKPEGYHYERRAILGLIASAVATLATSVRAESVPTIKVFKDANCGCCGAWVEHLRAHGFVATITETSEMQAVKARSGVPKALSSCHTAEIAGYVVEGHVPAHAIQRLLAETPQAIGLAVSGMPIGSPGMEGGTPVTYDVILFARDRQDVFGRYKADLPV